jgi:hypothetical protein
VENPCDKCIVKSCCSFVCEEKDTYHSSLCKELEKITPYMYSKSGNRKKHILLSIKKQAEACARKIEKDSNEINNIIFRRVEFTLKTFVHP